MTPATRAVLVTSAPLRRPPDAFDPGSGGVVEFYGVVRALEGTATIGGIEYEAHVAMAEHQLDALATETRAKFPIHTLVVHHRIGFIAAGEPSLFLRVAATHRGPAFAAAQWFIDELKQRVPIWKHPLERSTGREVAPADAAALPVPA